MYVCKDKNVRTVPDPFYASSGNLLAIVFCSAPLLSLQGGCLLLSLDTEDRLHLDPSWWQPCHHDTSAGQTRPAVKPVPTLIPFVIKNQHSHLTEACLCPWGSMLLVHPHSRCHGGAQPPGEQGPSQRYEGLMPMWQPLTPGGQS